MPEVAAWLTANTETIAETIAKGVCNYFGEAYVESTAPQPASDGHYHTFEELPDWAKPTIRELMDVDALRGREGDLDLSDDLLRSLVVNKRYTDFLLDQ